MPSSIARRLALLALPFALADCGGDGPAAPGIRGAAMAGTYALRTIDGQNLPTPIDAGLGADVRLDVVSDVYNLGADGTYSSRTVSRLTVQGSVFTDDVSRTGTWTVNGSTVTLTRDDGLFVTGVHSGGNTITVTQGGSVAVYQKERAAARAQP